MFVIKVAPETGIKAQWDAGMFGLTRSKEDAERYSREEAQKRADRLLKSGRKYAELVEVKK